MNPLQAANKLHSNLELAQAQLEGFLRDTLQAYIDFLPERGVSWTPAKFTDAAEYTFKEVYNGHFTFESDEFYQYGDTETDVVELPFAFIEDPEAYMSEIRTKKAEEEKKRVERDRKAAEDRLAHLKRQIVLEEAALSRKTMP